MFLSILLNDSLMGFLDKEEDAVLLLNIKLFKAQETPTFSTAFTLVINL